MTVDLATLTLDEMADLKAKLEEAVWSAAFENDLPDSSFLYVAPGGTKDSDSKTTPRDLRYFPVKDSAGAIDMPHLRNALARIPQSSLSAEVQAQCTAAAEKMMPKESAVESLLAGDFVPLNEKALKRNGEIQMKLIQPGWGSSGYYSPALLERDGPTVFKKGTKSYWNHPTPAEEASRPERDLRDLAAELTEDAHWLPNGPEGAGLYAHAKVFGGYAGAVEELAPHIGVSIRALGQAKTGEAAGRRGPIIEKLVAARSVDFVTEPGAGGQVVQLFESARGGERPKETQVDEQEAKALQESVTTLQTQMTALQESLKTTTEERDRLREGHTLQEAKGLVTAQVSAASLPDVTKARLIERLSANPVVKDGALDKDGLQTALEAAIKEETEYLTKLQVSPIRGMNSFTESRDEEAEKKLAGTFGRLGLSESAAKVAAVGRN